MTKTILVMTIIGVFSLLFASCNQGCRGGGCGGPRGPMTSSTFHFTSSSSMDCPEGQTCRRQSFYQQNQDRLQEELAQGKGETLDAWLVLNGCGAAEVREEAIRVHSLAIDEMRAQSVGHLCGGPH